ncbi:MAG: pseudouridine synthase, partial [Eubacteriales bacterium]|nr:pseudouridine synthase [Eubacteriales bacterium]
MIKPVYEDNHLLVVVKPQGKLTQSDETGDLSLQDECKQYIKEKYQKPGEVYLGLVHRLDRPVGGLVAFARTSKAASRLSEQLRTHHMEREYLAVVEG